MHLDHDDIGHRHDTIIVNGQRVTQDVNQEIATIRGYIPGEWIINCHMYAKRYQKPANVNIRVDKLNTKFKTLLDKNYIMKAKGDEITVTRMMMNTKGEITGQDEVFSPIASQKLIATGSGA
jgi:hypothetical protein